MTSDGVVSGEPDGPTPGVLLLALLFSAEFVASKPASPETSSATTEPPELAEVPALLVVLTAVVPPLALTRLTQKAVTRLDW